MSETLTAFDRFSMWNENQLKKTENRLRQAKQSVKNLEDSMPNILIDGAKIWDELSETQKAGVRESDPSKADRLENLSTVLKEQAEALAASTALVEEASESE